MSKDDLIWTKEHKERAAKEGWRLVTTFQNGSTHPQWNIARTEPGLKTDQVASRFVFERAQQMSLFHQGAMKLVYASMVRPANPKKKATA